MFDSNLVSATQNKQVVLFLFFIDIQVSESDTITLILLEYYTYVKLFKTFGTFKNIHNELRCLYCCVTPPGTLQGEGNWLWGSCLQMAQIAGNFDG